MKYSVSRSHTKTEYLDDIEADSVLEAIKKAKECPEENWETNPNDALFIDDYNAELQED